MLRETWAVAKEGGGVGRRGDGCCSLDCVVSVGGGELGWVRARGG